MRIFRRSLIGLALLIAVGIGWLAIAPPDLIRVGANYTAKTVCSNVILAGRDPQEVLAVDVQAPGHPLLRLMRVEVETVEGADDDEIMVRAGLLGFIGNGLAAGSSLDGCSTLPEPRLHRPWRGMSSRAKRHEILDDISAIWPQGSTVEPINLPALDAALNDTALVGPGMRAVVVVKDGRIVAERYGDGFDVETPLLGWSITKTVTAALIGRAEKLGIMSLDSDITYSDWQGDERRNITIRDLMGMASDLQWNESYGSVSDITRMLFLEPDMADFAASMPLDDETPQGIGESYEYSSGTSVILSKIWQGYVGGSDSQTFPESGLFYPLGMASATMERDDNYTFVGSSYMYATARDWARFGQFLLQKGVWEGQTLLPEGYVDWMTAPHPANPNYGRGQVWLTPANSFLPGDDAPLPAGSFFMNGHDGQSINVIPSENLVIVRLGLTPTSQGYRVSYLIDAVIKALE